jgi:ribonuclease P/MRP protein subunit POP5
LEKRIKPILPTLREKARYLAFEVISDQKIDFRQIESQILYRSREFLGTLGTAKAGIQIMKDNWNAEKQRGIIRVDHRWVHQLKASLLFANKIDGKNVIIKSIGLSGAINKVKPMIAG